MTNELIGNALENAKPFGQTRRPQAAWPPSPLDDGFWSTAVGVAIISGLIYLTCSLIAVRGGELFGILVGAQLLGQLAIAGMWLAMGRTPLAARLPAAAVTVFLFSIPILLVWNVPEAFLGVLLPMMLFVSAAALTTFVLHLAGGRVVFRASDSTHGAAIDRAHRQFSLRQIFALTTGVAVVLGLSRFSGLLTEAAVPILLSGAAIVMIALSAAWAILGDSVIAWVLALVVAPVMGVIVAQSTGTGNGWLVEVGAAVLVGVVIFTLLPFRLLGYRVRFRADQIAGSRQPESAVEIPQVVPEPARPESP